MTTSETPEQKRERCIRECVAKAPPLTPDVKRELRTLLTEGKSQ